MENLNDMFDLNNLIGRLRRIENDPAAQFEDIEDAFNDMIGQPIVAPIITMPAGILVLRARQVKSFNEVQSEEQISYLPQQLCEKFGRANMPDNPLFYGVLVNRDNEEEIPRLTNSIILSLFEACPFFRGPMIDVEYRAVVGCWESYKPLDGLTIINPDLRENRSGINRQVANGLSNFLAEIEELRRAGADFYSDDEIINFQRYMHHKFTDNVNADREYWIPAKFTFDVLVQPIIDGIFYESSQGRVDDRLKDCISVALKPQSVDTKLHFLGVYDVLIKNDGEKVTISAPIFRNL